MVAFVPGSDANRVIMVANRLPMTASVGEGGISFAASAGGLATALAEVHEQRGGVWVGWPGITTDQLDQAGWDHVVETLRASRLVSVPLSRDESERFYDGFSNSFIWPILHSITGKTPLDTDDWEIYREINQRFADAVIANYAPGDLIWVHDFHLFLVPGMIRAAIPDAPIGFFLHVPFPTADVFRTLPHRTELLRGLLGASLVGFHTASYLRYFSTALTELLGLPTDIDRVTLGDRTVRLGVFPVGIEAPAFEAVARDPATDGLIAEIRGEDTGKLMVAVDRLDYTKGVQRRLLGFERLLATHPELHERVRLINLSVPSREAVPAYQELRQEVDGLVGRINGRFSTPRWTPIHYMFRAVDRHSLVALYRATDVMLVTPIRDGMNLVAKEFVASRVDGDGVLVLSEFAGAAADLPEAVIVNPYDIDQLAGRMAEALTMGEADRRTRMASLRHRVGRYGSSWWSTTFLNALQNEWRASIRRPVRMGSGALRLSLDKLRTARRRLLLLDYDGTLTPLAERPELALPDEELLDLLARLSRDRRHSVHIVSGRSAGFLERWLGHLPVNLHAEHGAASRPLGAKDWIRASVGLGWMERVRGVFEDFSRVTPGAFTETKEFGLCWHWRSADPGSEKAANELVLHLAQVLQRTGADVLVGNRIVEVRAQGINKGLIARAVLSERSMGTGILAAGDDSTDEELFRVLPPEAITIRVGSGPSHAGIAIPDVPAFRRVLAEIVGWGSGN